MLVSGEIVIHRGRGWFLPRRVTEQSTAAAHQHQAALLFFYSHDSGSESNSRYCQAPAQPSAGPGAGQDGSWTLPLQYLASPPPCCLHCHGRAVPGDKIITSPGQHQASAARGEARPPPATTDILSVTPGVQLPTL